MLKHKSHLIRTIAMLVPGACDICKVTCNVSGVEAILDIIDGYFGPVLNKSWLLFPAFECARDSLL